MKTRETEKTGNMVKMEGTIKVLIQVMAPEIARIREYLPGLHRDELDTESFIRYSIDRLIKAKRITKDMGQPTLVYAILWQFGYHDRMAMDLGYLSDADCGTVGIITMIKNFMLDVHQISNLGQDWEDEFGDY